MPTQFTPFEDPPRIMVIDNDKEMREALCDLLTLEGYIVRSVESLETAKQEVEQRRYDLVICTLVTPHFNALELLSHLSTEKRDVLVVILTQSANVESAIEAMKKGAYDYMIKPVQLEEVVRVVKRGLDWHRLQQENFHLREAITLYKLSEAMAQSLSVETILELILDTTLTECQTDVASLVLRDPVSGKFTEYTRKFGNHAQADLRNLDGGAGELNLSAIIDHYRQEPNLLVHGTRALRFFITPPKNKRWLSLCSISLKVQDKMIGMINTYSYTKNRKFNEGQRRLLFVLASRAAASIENARLYQSLVGRHTDLIRANMSLEANFRATVIGLAHALEENDPYTIGHSQRVSHYAQILGQGLGLVDKDLEQLAQAALMHDIGKIGIRNEKLNKPGKLTPEEQAMFRTHPAKGRRILEPIPFMMDLIPGAFCHHENYDGSGYPQGLMNENIPLIGRIVAIADTYDAMTSDRSYRKALRHEQAIAELERCSDIQFDRRLVGVFTKYIDEYRLAERNAGRDVVK